MPQAGKHELAHNFGLLRQACLPGNYPSHNVHHYKRKMTNLCTLVNLMLWLRIDISAYCTSGTGSDQPLLVIIIYICQNNKLLYGTRYIWGQITLHWCCGDGMPSASYVWWFFFCLVAAFRRLIQIFDLDCGITICCPHTTGIRTIIYPEDKEQTNQPSTSDNPESKQN